MNIDFVAGLTPITITYYILYLLVFSFLQKRTYASQSFSKITVTLIPGVPNSNSHDKVSIQRNNNSPKDCYHLVIFLCELPLHTVK